MTIILRPGQRILNIPGYGVRMSRRAVGAGGNGLLNALIAYWPGNEASGNLQDAHTNALHLTDANTVTNAAGKVYATARQYTRANTEYHTRAGDDALLSMGDVDLSFAAWVYIDSKSSGSTVQTILAKDTTGAGGREYIATYDNGTDRLRWTVFNGTSVVGAVIGNALGSPSLSTWYLFVGWHDSAANTINMQINNGTVDSVATTGAPGDTASAFRIGATSNNANWWNGRIGPTAFWKSAAGGGAILSAAQRDALWNAGAGLAYAQFTT